MARARKEVDEALVLALACGSTLAQAARNAGVSDRTAQRRVKEATFQSRLAEMRQGMIERTGQMLTAGGVEAVKTLVGLLDQGQPAQVRLGACRTLLDMGIRLREHADLNQRVAALEGRAAPADSQATPACVGGSHEG